LDNPIGGKDKIKLQKSGKKIVAMRRNAPKALSKFGGVVLVLGSAIAEHTGSSKFFETKG
jgi:hypothetical protein